MKYVYRLASTGGLTVLVACLLAFSGGTADEEGGWLGVSIQNVTPGLKEALDYDRDVGVLVNDVEEDSPAEEAGIQEGDIIIEYDGNTISNTGSLIRKVRAGDPGDEVNLVVVRKGREMRLTVKIGEVPKSKGFWLEGEEKKGPHVLKVVDEKYGWLGVHLQDVTDQLGDYFGVSDGEGALITEVIQNSPAEKAGLKAGDVIVEYDGDEIDGVDELVEAVRETEIGEEVKIEVMRDRRKRTIVVEIGRIPKDFSEPSVDLYRIPSPGGYGEIWDYEDYLQPQKQHDIQRFKDNIWRLRIPRALEEKELMELKERIEKLEQEIKQLKERL